jgi:hypothetical protein
MPLLDGKCMPSIDEQFSLFRASIEHEDTNAHNRINWALLFHGLLFSAFVGGVGLYEKINIRICDEDAIGIGLGLLCILGIISGVIAFFGVLAAERALRRLTLWWECSTSIRKRSAYPPHYRYKGMLSHIGTSAAFLILATIWTVLLYIVCTATVNSS